MKKYYNLVLRPTAYIPLIIAVIASVWGWYAFQNPKSPAGIIKITRDAISEEVIVTGKTTPIDSVNLGFERGGKVARVSVDVGARVWAGAPLVELDTSELLAQYTEAQAKVDAAQAKLVELQQGTRPEEIQIQEVRVINATIALEDAKRGLIDKLNDAHTKADDTVHNAGDQLFSNPRSAVPQINVVNFYQKTDIEYQRSLLEPLFSAWRATLTALSGPDDLLDVSQETKKNLEKIRGFIDALSIGVNSLIPTSSLSQTTIDGYKTDISAARTNINTAITNLSTAEEKKRAADSSLTLEKNQLALKKAGNTPEQISAQSAAVRQAEAGVAAIGTQMRNAALRAPFAGTVTKQDAKIGEIISPSAPVVSIISQDKLEIDANVPEVDIGRVTLGNPVVITLDAFQGEKFAGKVAYIEPAETIVDGVVNYKIKIAFDTPEERFKSGLTANLSIETVKKSGVLVVPQYAIIETDTGTFVRKMIDGKTIDIPVMLGIRSKSGFVEIVSGVNEGDEILNIGLKTAK